MSVGARYMTVRQAQTILDLYGGPCSCELTRGNPLILWHHQAAGATGDRAAAPAARTAGQRQAPRAEPQGWSVASFTSIGPAAGQRRRRSAGPVDVMVTQRAALRGEGHD